MWSFGCWMNFAILNGRIKYCLPFVFAQPIGPIGKDEEANLLVKKQLFISLKLDTRQALKLGTDFTKTHAWCLAFTGNNRFQ
jgi:hypothetical protein